jgi:hypothetical protein
MIDLAMAHMMAMFSLFLGGIVFVGLSALHTRW